MALNVKKVLLKARGLAKRGETDAAAQLYASIIDQFPMNKQAINGLALLDQAASPVKKEPTHEQINNLIMLLNMRKFQQVLVEGQLLVSLFPHNAQIYDILGAANLGLGMHEEAITNCTRSLQLKPDQARACNNLGIALSGLGRYEEAITSYSRAIQLKSDYPRAHYNLGNVLREIGKHKDAIDSYGKALELKPDYIQAHSNQIYCLSEIESNAPSFQLELAKSFGSLVASRVECRYSSWHCVRSAQKLTIGFVSADLSAHPVGYFLEGLLSEIDLSAFQLNAYSNQPLEDELTARIKPLFTKWVSIFEKPDSTVAQIIHSDAPHILIDLSGHTGGNRLGVFAYKPAPIQVTWLGYWGTTGVAEIDYKLGDIYMNPVEEESWFSETLWRLPDSFLCFMSPTTSLSVSPLPALESGYITFGCFNKLSKMNDRVVAVWAKILNALPASRLYLKSAPLISKTAVEQTKKQFSDFGIKEDRLILEEASPREEYLGSYNRVDIALDPFPYPGGTTSAEALWMGVPVLTRKGGSSPLSRQGESILHSAGLPDWIATDDENYVSKAVSYASDINALSQLRGGLRDQIESSPLLDTERFAYSFEVAMKCMWELHTQKPRDCL